LAWTDKLILKNNKPRTKIPKSFFIMITLPQYRYAIKRENKRGKGRFFSWLDRCD